MAQIPLKPNKSRFSQSNVLAVSVFACISFSLVAIILEHGLSIDNPYSNWGRFKNHYLKTTTDIHTNVLVLGNSKLFRGLDTPLLNQKSRESGCGLQFYNACYPGMNSAEFINNLDSIAANTNLNPSYVLFMPSLFRSKTNLLSQRRRNNALIRLWRVQMLNLHENDKPLSAYKNLHLSMFQRATNKSKLTRKLILNDVPQKVSQAGSLKVQSNDGYLPFDEDPSYGIGHKRQLRFLNNPESFTQLSARLSLSMNANSSISDVAKIQSDEALSFNDSAKTLSKKFINKIRSLGATSVALFFPQGAHLPERNYYSKAFPKIKQVVADDRKIEQFINKDLWFVHQHLNSDGAQLFTSTVFEQMCHGVGN